MYSLYVQGVSRAAWWDWTTWTTGTTGSSGTKWAVHSRATGKPASTIHFFWKLRLLTLDLTKLSFWPFLKFAIEYLKINPYNSNTLTFTKGVKHSYFNKIAKYKIVLIISNVNDHNGQIKLMHFIVHYLSCPLPSNILLRKA